MAVLTTFEKYCTIGSDLIASGFLIAGRECRYYNNTYGITRI